MPKDEILPVLQRLYDIHGIMLENHTDTYKLMPLEVEKLSDQELQQITVIFVGKSMARKMDRPAQVKLISGRICHGDCFRG